MLRTNDLIGKQLPYNADPITKTPAYDAPYYRELHHKMHGDYTRELINYKVLSNDFSIFEYAGMLSGLEHSLDSTMNITLPTPNKTINLFIIFTVDNVNKKSYYEFKEVPQEQGFYQTIKEYDGIYETILFYFLDISAGTSDYSGKKVYRNPEIKILKENYYEKLTFDGTYFQSIRKIAEYEKILIKLDGGYVVFYIDEENVNYQDGLDVWANDGEIKILINLIVKWRITGTKKQTIIVDRVYKNYIKANADFTIYADAQMKTVPNQPIYEVIGIGKNLGYTG